MKASWKETLVGVAIAAVLFGIIVYDGVPSWLRAVVTALVFLFPGLPFLLLIPWHFVAKHQGLVSKSAQPCKVSLSEETLFVQQGSRTASYALRLVARARYAQNANWTASTMLEDALTLFASNGIELARVPESAAGFRTLVVELRARSVPVEDAYVSAPAILG